MIRKAREAARDKIRSVNAVRHHHRAPHPAKPKSQPQSHGFSSVSLKQVDDAFNAALDDESDFSNPFCDIEPPSAVPVVATVVENKQAPSNNNNCDNKDLFSDPPTIHDDLFNSDSIPLPPQQNNIDPLMEQSIVHSSQDKSDPNMELPTVDSLLDTGDTENEPSGPFHDTSHHHSDEKGIIDDGDNEMETVTQESTCRQNTQVPEQDQLIPLAPNIKSEPTVETSLPSVNYSEDSTADSHKDDSSTLEIPLVETGEHQLTTTAPTVTLDHHLLNDDQFDDLFPDDYITETGSNPSDKEDRIVITKPHEDLPSNIDPSLPSIDDLSQGLAVPRSDHHDYLFEESPLSSIPSSFENEHTLTLYDSEHVEVIAEKSKDKIKQEDELLNESSESIEADLDRLLASKPSKGSHKEKQLHKSKPATSKAPKEKHSSPHLDSGVFEHETGMSPTPERDCKDEPLPMSEHHFASSEYSPQVPRSAKINSSPPKKNSLGKVAPPRPPISPKLQKRLSKAKEAATGDVKVKIVQPLNSAPPEYVHGDVSHHSRPLKSGSKQTRTMDADSKESRIPADDLFGDDNTSVKLGEQSQKKTDQYSDTQPQETTEPHYLPLWFHLILAGCLYLYYSLNIFPYIAGFFAGFLMVYFLVGSVFIYYVQTEEKARAEDAKLKESVEPSDEFVKHMNVKFEDLALYQGRKFTGTMSYDPATHHPSQRQRTTLKLSNDFSLYIHIYDPAHGDTIKKTVNIRNCNISLVPQEVAKNRKRRWSKKFPIHISNEKIGLSVFVFSPHARDKEDWFRRMKSASDGFTTEQIIKERKKFFAYMQHYFQLDALYHEASPSVPTPLKSRSKRSPHSSSSSAHPPRKPERVQFSKAVDSIDEDDPEFNTISITKGSPQLQHRSEGHNRSSHRLTSSSSSGSLHSGTSVDPPYVSSARPQMDNGFEVIPRPQIKLPRATMWINAMAARLCWDVWHEKRWKDWVMSRIQKKLIRVKTPSFIDQLRLTDVNLGNDMPVVKGLHHGPVLDLRGIWVYLNVVYEGQFVMTIETKMKLGVKEEGKETGTQQMAELIKQKGDSKLPMSSHHHPSSSSAVKMSHSSAARALGSSVDPEEIDSGSDEEDSQSSGAVHPLERSTTESQKTDTNDTTVPHVIPSSSTSGKEGRFKSMYSYAKAGATKITKRVVNTKFVRRAAEKVSSYPLILTVDVRRLEGVLAVNVPPPPTDTIWYGFQKSPKLDLVAKPKLGHREVTYSRVTHWIEKKLCELVDKKLLLPEMEDLVIPILNSGMPDLDVLKPIGNDPETPTTVS